MAFLAGALTLAIANRPALAEDISNKQIRDSLQVSKTPAITQDDAAFIDRVRSHTRSRSLDEREQMAAIATKRPKVDLDISFDYNSAALTSKAEPQLNELGKALTSSELAGAVFLLGGHTDAKGSDDYNQGLSERRAETVKRFLVERYRIPAANLISAGYGKKGLKNPADPFAAENRRIEIVNAAEPDQASK